MTNPETEKPYYSYFLVACLVTVFLTQMVIEPEAFWTFAGTRSEGLAGFNNSSVRSGAFWKLFTSPVVHGGIIHLAFNCYALYVLGRLIETLSNRCHLGIIFLLSAVGGNIFNLVIADELPIVGASAGIIGLLGYMTVYAYRRRELLSNRFLMILLFNIGFIAIIGVLLTWLTNDPNNSENSIKIDNYGHLGGLLTGAIYGLVQIPSEVYKDPRDASGPMEIAGIAAIGVFAFVSAFVILLLLLHRILLS